MAFQKYNQIQGLLKNSQQNKFQINYFHSILNKFILRQKSQSFKTLQLFSHQSKSRKINISKDYYQIQRFIDKITQVSQRPAWQKLWKLSRHSTQKKLAFDKICRIFNVRILEQTKSAFRSLKFYTPPVKILIQRHKSVDRCSNRPFSHRPSYDHRLGTIDSTRIWNQRNYLNQVKLENLVNILSRLKRRKLFLTFLVFKKLPAPRKNPKVSRNKPMLKENQLRILKKLGRKIESKRREILIEALYELIKYSYHKFMNHYGNLDKYRKSINTARY